MMDESLTTAETLAMVSDESGRPVDQHGEHESIRRHDIRTDRGDLYLCADCRLFTFQSAAGLDAFPCEQGAVSDE